MMRVLIVMQGIGVAGLLLYGLFNDAVSDHA